MKLSSRVAEVSDSITMRLNEKFQQLSNEGKIIFNLSTGQLPIKPPQEFIEKIQHQLNFLKSYQYSPVTGMEELKDKVFSVLKSKRELPKSYDPSLIFSNGTKHSIYNALGAILEPGDEVILLAPYWVSYPEMIKFWGGQPKVVNTYVFDGYTPVLEEIKALISSKTKAIILNSPNNPAGIHYSEEWMKDFARLVSDYPDLWILSDEVYSDLYYFDPAPRYYYEFNPELLDRTVIFHGISKVLASTGLRIGYAVGPKDLVQAMSRIQGQTTSGPNSLIQRALIHFDWKDTERFLDPVKIHLRKSANILREKCREAGLHNIWYQSTSAFYFMLDFSKTPKGQSLGEVKDCSHLLCDELLEKEGIALVPGSDFGMPHSARLSLVMEEVPFTEAMTKLVKFLSQK